MSQPGVYQLLKRDRRVDPYLTVTDRLRERLEAARSAGGAVTPATITQTHRLSLHGTYRPFVASAGEYIKVVGQGASTLHAGAQGSLEFTIPNYGHFTSDMVFHVQLGAAATPSTAPAGTLLRYCAYPGLRLFEAVGLYSKELKLDEYTADDAAFANKFEIGADRRAAWDAACGQQQVHSAEVYNANGWTQIQHYAQGLQTPAATHAAADLWVPALFDHCQDRERPLVNDLGEHAPQRTVRVTLAALSKLLFAQDDLGTAQTLPLSELAVRVTMYCHQVYVNPEIYSVFLRSSKFRLIRVRRTQHNPLNTASGSVRLSQLKFPCTHFYAGVRDRANTTDPDLWHRYGRAITRTAADALRVPVVYWNDALPGWQLASRTAKSVTQMQPVISTARLVDSGIPLFPSVPIGLYSAYLPYRYGRRSGVTASDDPSALLFPFGPHPGPLYDSGRPDGVLNFSTSRELDFEYTGTAISPQDPAELVVSATVLNFLVRRGDDLSLRYAL